VCILALSLPKAAQLKICSEFALKLQWYSHGVDKTTEDLVNISLTTDEI
jgi:hypothetical protein